jgi:hypothetical protein
MAMIYRDGRPYLYKSVRRDGRVTSEYVTSGAAAVLIDRLETIDKDKRDYERWHAKQEGEASDALERDLDVLCKQARELAEAALNEAGYHKHHRGEWRKSRARRDRQTARHLSDDGLLGDNPPN